MSRKMKKSSIFRKCVFIFFALFFLSISSLFAQDNYIPIAVEGAHYRIRVENTGTYWTDSTWYGYALRGDTVINNQLWKKVYHRWFEDRDGQFFIVWDSLHAVVRDDTINRKVYSIKFRHNPFGYYCPLNEEFLLYDFSVMPGDTLPSCVWGNFPVHCTSIQYYQYFGSNRKCFITDYWEVPAVEGIGTPSGLFEFPNILVKGYGVEPNYDYPVLENYCIGNDYECGQLYLGEDNSHLTENLEVIYIKDLNSFFVTGIERDNEDCEFLLYSFDGKLILYKRGNLSEVPFLNSQNNYASLYIVRLRYGNLIKSFKIKTL
ncbi:MAG: hypothetical protein A2X11_02675 [Bacteroidetes bacterium GWE2_42_24]|nr:MAG: hypothetical protein A2X11_02675 [Bacteroidetes bacterium GWE2_42_24]OFY32374.1 MAG: hypothetical protein A2X09_16420 [Bacteroidetes bacterium GWF2_43_11]HCU17676.1 hypothetical protein [Bacteroidales bacterium]